MSVTKFLKKAQEIKAQAQYEADEGPPAASHDESNWLVSYADMMTLLCGFFIMLFSMSKLDQPQYERVKEAVTKQFGGDYKSPSKELADFVKQAVHEAGIEKQTGIKTDTSGVSLIFQSTLFFETLSAEVKPDGRAVLDKLITSLADRQLKDGKQYRIVVEGHTDSRPILAGTFPSNWELSGARASRVIRLFLDHRYAPDKLTAIGYADTRPEVDARTPQGTYDEEALAKNRRVVLRILDPQVESIPFATGDAPDAAKSPDSAAPAQAVAPVPAQATGPAPALAVAAHAVAPPQAAAQVAVTAPVAAQAPVKAPVPIQDRLPSAAHSSH